MTCAEKIELDVYRRALRGEDIYANTLVSLCAHTMPTQGQKIMRALGESLAVAVRKAVNK